MGGNAYAHVAIYSRKSKYTGKGESIENQIGLCRQYIAANFGDDASKSAAVYEDEGFSGGNLERPQFREMMADAKNRKFTAVVVYRLDRISRNIGDFAGLIEELGDLGISFVSIREQFDTSSPMGRAMMYIASVFSQLERETIAERIRDNMRELAKTGRWLGGTTPTGYASESVEKITLDGKVKKSCKLKLIPGEAALIKLIFEKFLETNSLTKTDSFLLKSGLTTKNGKSFSRFAIRNILKNPVYMIADTDAYLYLTEKKADLFSEKPDFNGACGIMAYNRTLQKPGKANKVLPISEWTVSVGAHPGIVSGAVWIRVQELLEQNRQKGYRKPRGSVSLLSGLLHCGNCGDYMRPKLSSRYDVHGERQYSYLCSMKERSRGVRCRIANANGNMLDRAVIEEIGKLSSDKTELLRLLDGFKKALDSCTDGSEAEFGRLNKALEENEDEIRCLVLSLGKASGTSAEEHLLRWIGELHGRSKALKEGIGELIRRTEENELSRAEFDSALHTILSPGFLVNEMSAEQKRRAARICIKKIVWDGSDVHIYLFGSRTPEPSCEDSK